MKRFFVMLVVVSLLILPITSFAKNDVITINSKAAILIDASSGKILYEKNADQQLAIASITKVMTLNLIFDAVENGKLDLNEKIMISQNASGMGGSQAFIDAGYNYTASELIKSIIIASANDSAVAMAERVAGSEEAFVHKMNEKAKALGMNNTVFKNCTGLPESGHLSSARDVAKMSQELLKHKDYFTWATIWMDEINHEKDGRVTELVNTNKLIRSLNGCNGLKTGYTSEAGFCVTTTAERDGMRLISVILGGNTSKERFKESAELINYGFANYSNQIVLSAGEELGKVEVKNGTEKVLKAVSIESFSLSINNDGTDKIEKKVILPEKIDAPIKAGQEVGSVIISLNGEEVKQIKLYSDKDYNKAGFMDKLKEIIVFWK